MMVLSVPNTKIGKEVEIEIDPNLTTLYDKEFYVIFYENIKFFLYEHFYRPISSCVYMYPKTFGCSIFLLILTGSICTVIFTSKTNQYPCIKYTNTDLASTVSQSCLSYLWAVSCSLSKRTFDPSNTWWTNSPDGINTIKCDSFHTGSMCGAGSYQTIVLAIQYCNPYYRG